MNDKKLNCQNCGYKYCPFRGADREISAYLCEDFEEAEEGRDMNKIIGGTDMSDILIKGMEMPLEYPVLFRIHLDGKVFADIEDSLREYQAVPVPSHETNFGKVTENAETLAGFLSTLTPDRHPESWLKWLSQSAEKSETVKVDGKTYSAVPSYADAKLGGVVLGKTAPTTIEADADDTNVGSKTAEEGE